MTEQQIHDAVREFLQTRIIFDTTRAIASDESFLASGILDSTGVLELIAFLEDTYGIHFQDDELVAANFDSLGRVASFVARKVNAPEVH
ncbi:D-alanine--poly(phosphoribitol) ligase subunit 2 [Planctomycetaceae bacterium]|nr:D-alanine--poly(phosphoribitol) ligase subunit 2 [Planctomycetaceae bacterium]